MAGDKMEDWVTPEAEGERDDAHFRDGKSWDEEYEVKSTGPGGAEKVEIQQTSLWGGSFLRERVKDILFNNLVQEMSLQDVGYLLHQCFIQCCKPLSSARLSTQIA